MGSKDKKITQKAEKLLLKARELRQAGKYEDAIPLLNQADKLITEVMDFSRATSTAAIFNEMGICHGMTGDVVTASKCFWVALTTCPTEGGITRISCGLSSL